MKEIIMKNIKLIVPTAILAAVIVGVAVNAMSGTPEVKETVAKAETTATAIKAEPQLIKAEDLEPLEDLITGIEDLKVAKGTDLDIKSLVFVDKDIIKSVTIDDSKVNYDKAGSYEVTYTIQFDGGKLSDWAKKNHKVVKFDTAENTVTVKTTVTVTVLEDKDVKDNKDVITNDNKDKAVETNKEAAGDNAVKSDAKPEVTENKPSAGNTQANSGSAGTDKKTESNGSANTGSNKSESPKQESPKHEHNWQPTYGTRQVVVREWDEQVVVREWDEQVVVGEEPVYEQQRIGSQCAFCGGDSSNGTHIACIEAAAQANGGGLSGTCDIPVYGNVQVGTKPVYGTEHRVEYGTEHKVEYGNEQYVTGYSCSCGATK